MEEPESDIIKVVKYFDVFPKVQDDIKIRTGFSGLVTIVCSFLVFLLVTSEFYHYIWPGVQSRVSVDSSGLGNKLRVNFDFTLLTLRCDSFGIDMVDAAGDQQLEITENVKKTPLGYMGCKVHGYLETHKVKGEFHIAFGRKAESAGDSSAHIHRFSPTEIFTFNCSHVINRLSFGEDFPGVVQPLDGAREIVNSGLGRFQYFLQVVPTIYEYASGRRLETNQYSVTENTVYVHPEKGGSFKQPGIFFKFEISPYTVNYKEQHKSLSHLITSLCAIVGGVWVVSGFISSSAWYLNRLLKNA